MASNEWFRRVWTVQEAYFAREAILVLGRSQCSYSALQSYSQWYGDITLFPGVFRARGLILDYLVTAFEKSPGGRTRDAFRFLPHWLSLVRSSNLAADQRDTVYGVLGIITSYWPQWPQFPVEYKLSPAQVYERFTKYIVRQTGTLNMLEPQYEEKDGSTPLEGLPSWVPDMRCAKVQDGISAMNAKTVSLPALTRATTGSAVDMPTLAQSGDGEIRLRGKLIATVGSPSSRELSHGFKALEEWMTALADAGLDFPARAFLPIPGTKTNILGQLIDSVDVNGRAAVVLFLTSHNRLGVAPFNVRRGDYLVLLAGLDCPAVLRAGRGGTHTFVGRVAIEGVMDGEAWDAGKDPSDLDMFVLV